MFAGDLVAEPGLNDVALPIAIVYLELNKFHLRVLVEQILQQIRRVVEREADMFDQSLLLKGEDEIPGADGLGVFDSAF